MPHLYVITYTNFVLFNNTNLLFVNLYDHIPTYLLSQCILFVLFNNATFIIFVNLYDHAPHFYYMYHFHFAKFIIFAHLYDHAPHV